MEHSTEGIAPIDMNGPAMSKNRLKKLKRDQAWEENRAKRKAKRKEKIQDKKQRKRAAREEANPTASVLPKATHSIHQERTSKISKKPKRPQFEQLPITLILDCGFDDLMMDKERKSLSSQVTRCYSDNHKAPQQVHLAISSFGGHLKERFDGLLAGQYHSWKNVRFFEGDFVQAAAQAKDWMQGDQGGNLAGVFAEEKYSAQALANGRKDGEVIYLTSDSPDTLTELRPYSTYIIGGLVDRNKHKGICYKRALDHGMKTAKLPIGDYMKMTSRFVLATNHVVEIMLRWLELGDWGKAFLQVVPKRKGGVLKESIGVSGEKEVDKDSDEGFDVVHGKTDNEALEESGSERATAGQHSEAQAAKLTAKPGNIVVSNTELEIPGPDVDEVDDEVEASSDSEDGGVQV